jgi:hypothetical protein
MRAVPWIVLAAALVGIATFSQGLGVIDTIVVLASGAAAGMALAAIAAARRKKP